MSFAKRRDEGWGTTPLIPGSPFNPWHKSCGFFPADAVCAEKRISVGAKLTYTTLVRIGGKDGRCFPSHEHLARSIGVSDRQVRRYLKELEESGLLGHVRGGKGRSNNYQFLWHPIFDAFLAAKEEKRTKDPDRGVQSDRTTLSGGSGHPRPTNDNLITLPKTHSADNQHQAQRQVLIERVLERIALDYADSLLVQHDQIGPRLAAAIEEKLDGYPLDQFVRYVKRRFDDGQSPFEESGPRRWVEFVHWAVDFSREKKGLPPKEWQRDYEDDGRIKISDLYGRSSSRYAKGNPRSHPECDGEASCLDQPEYDVDEGLGF